MNLVASLFALGAVLNHQAEDTSYLVPQDVWFLFTEQPLVAAQPAGRVRVNNCADSAGCG